MLEIVQRNRSDVRESQHWHVGETLPPITSRFVTFHADGDELLLIEQLLRNYRELLRNQRAAPDLYAALEAIADACPSNAWIQKTARPRLAKARGETDAQK
jgi:hypothetical protein